MVSDAHTVPSTTNSFLETKITIDFTELKFVSKLLLQISIIISSTKIYKPYEECKQILIPIFIRD